MKSGFFDSMAPNARRAFIVSIVLGAVATVLYLFMVEPAESKLRSEQRRLSELQDKLSRISSDLKASGDIAKNLESLNADKKPFDDAILEPLFGSYSMSARKKLEPLLLGAGLTEINYADAPFRALPVPMPIMPRQLHTRAAVKITCRGSYQGAVSFLLRLERDFPLVSLQSFDFAVAKDSKSLQDITYVLEWPAVGKVTRK